MFGTCGWTCEHNGWISHGTGLRFNWVSSSLSFLKNQLSIAWTCKVSELCSHRKGFDIKSIDVHMVQCALRSLPDEDQVFVKSLLCGRHLTNDILCKYVGSNVSDRCNLCNQRDGKKHRFFECPELMNQRKGKTKVLNWVRKGPLALLNFGVLPIDFDLYRWKVSNLPEFGPNIIPPVGSHQNVFLRWVCLFREIQTFDYCW